MRILIITQYYYPENFKITDLAEELVKRGNEVNVMTAVPNYPEGKYYRDYGVFNKRKETINGVHIDRIPIIPRGNNKIFLFLNYLSYAVVGSIYVLKYLFKRTDLIFVFETSPITVGIPAIVLKKLKKTPIYFWVLDLWPDSITATNSIKSEIVIKKINTLVKFIYKNCDKILISSKLFRGKLLKQNVEEQKIKYLPNWAEELYERNSNIDDEILLPKGFIIMFAGNIGVAQDFPTLINVAKSLSDYKDIHFVILGDGRNFEWVNAEIISNGLNKTFHLLGKKSPELAKGFMQSADVLFLSLTNDPIFMLTVPGKLQVYMAQSKPIIAALSGEGANIINEAECGISCSPGDVDEIRGAVQKLYKSEKETLLKLGLNSRSYYDEHFKRGKIISELSNLFTEDLEK